MDNKMFIITVVIAAIFAAGSMDADAKKFRGFKKRAVPQKSVSPPPQKVEVQDKTSFSRAAGTAAVGGFAAGAGVAAGQAVFSGDRSQKCDPNSTNCQQQK